MKVTATILFFFSVLIRIQSEIIYIYKYENFGDFFHQGLQQDFNIYRYDEIDTLLKTENEGPNSGGAFIVHGGKRTIVKYDGWLVSVTANFYCGNEDTNMGFFVYWDGGDYDGVGICQDYDVTSGWVYNYTWVTSLRFMYPANFSFEINAYNTSLEHPNGFDELRITTTSVRPPQQSTTSRPAPPSTTNPRTKPRVPTKPTTKGPWTRPPSTTKGPWTRPTPPSTTANPENPMQNV